MTRNQKILESGSYPKLLLNLCLPSIIIMLVMTVYNMADTFFIGQTGDPAKVAALSLCGPIFSILSGLGTLLGSGGCTAISLALGKKDESRIKACSSFCAAGSMIIGVVFLAVALLFQTPICKALGADADTMDYALSYLRIVAVGAPFILFNNVFSNIIRADGAAVESMICNGIGTIANIILDAVFILALSMDVEGAAIATVIGNVLSCIYILWYLAQKQRAFSLNPRDISLKKEIVVPVLTLGLPLACSTLLMSVSSMFSNRLMISYGSTALAAQGVASKAGMLISMLIMGVCMGLQPAISYNYGAGDKKRMLSIIKKTGIFTVCLGTVLSLICFFFRNQLILFFIDNEEVVRNGQIMIIAGLVTGPFYGLYQLCQTFLQSTGKASYATFTALLDKGLFYLPILYLMNHFFGMYGIAFTGAVTLIFSLTAGIFLSLKWYRSDMRGQQTLSAKAESL